MGRVPRVSAFSAWLGTVTIFALLAHGRGQARGLGSRVLPSGAPAEPGHVEHLTIPFVRDEEGGPARRVAGRKVDWVVTDHGFAPPEAANSPTAAHARQLAEDEPRRLIVLLRPKRGKGDRKRVEDRARNSKARGGKRHVAKFNREFKGGAANGFAGEFSADAVQVLAASPEVWLVEVDADVRAVGLRGQRRLATQTGAVWNLDRIDGVGGDNVYQYPDNMGSGASVFVADTGIRQSHAEFGGRALPGTDYVSGSSTNDCNGHGTHCAGSVAGTVYGVAKHATVYADRVLDCDGSGSFSYLIEAIDNVASRCSASSWTGGPCVVSASLGALLGYTYHAPIIAIDNALDAGVVTVVAAGNEDADACDASPAQAPNAITVGASSSSDQRSGFSNWGSCVDIMAPGQSIVSAWHTSDNVQRTLSGTSMACPHVAGAVAAMMAASGLRGEAAINQFMCLAETGAIGDLKGSTDAFLHVPAAGWCSSACPCDDQCPADDSKTVPGICGCGNPDTDSDGDGVMDCNDACPTEPAFSADKGPCDCDASDSDSDGTYDCVDVCDGPEVDSDGDGVVDCGIDPCANPPDVDSDGDGVIDCEDVCPQEPAYQHTPGPCGCDATDTDGDGALDCQDLCVSEPAYQDDTGPCDCSTSDVDGDGQLDCEDKCPNNPDAGCEVACVPDKKQGNCDCGFYRVCKGRGRRRKCTCEVDQCPLDAKKRAPGQCGCGTPDRDSDRDRVPDCLDTCPGYPEPTDGCACGERYKCRRGRCWCKKLRRRRRRRKDDDDAPLLGPAVADWMTAEYDDDDTSLLGNTFDASTNDAGASAESAGATSAATSSAASVLLVVVPVVVVVGLALAAVLTVLVVRRAGGSTQVIVLTPAPDHTRVPVQTPAPVASQHPAAVRAWE